MDWKVTVTLEFPTEAPETGVYDISAGSVGTAVARAIRLAQKAYPRRRWSSLVALAERSEQ